MAGEIPLVRVEIEVERMRHGLMAAFINSADEVNRITQDAIEEYCTAENLTRVIEDQAQSSIKAAIEEEIDRFFRYGKGRSAIRDAVQKQLDLANEESDQ